MRAHAHRAQELVADAERREHQGKQGQQGREAGELTGSWMNQVESEERRARRCPPCILVAKRISGSGRRGRRRAGWRLGSGAAGRQAAAVTGGEAA